MIFTEEGIIKAIEKVQVDESGKGDYYIIVKSFKKELGLK